MVWSINDVSDLTGKVIFITGATSGLGLCLSKFFSSKNATLIIACRNQKKMLQVASQCTPGPVHQLLCDVSDLDSVRQCVNDFNKLNVQNIDVLILNAGIMMPPFTLSKQGIEQTFATNHLGHWLLTGLLLDRMTTTSTSRILCVSSKFHAYVHHIDYDAVKGDSRNYSPQKAYFSSKLANLWFTNELNRKLVSAGRNILAIASHPGVCGTDLLKDEQRPFLWGWFGPAFMNWVQSVEQGSQSIIMACTDPNANRDCYYGPSGFDELSGPPTSKGSRSPTVFDENAAKELWQVSEELTGFKYQL